MKFIVGILLKLFSIDEVANLIGKAFARLIILARKTDKWTQYKVLVSKINAWTSVLMEVYKDDELTPEEEQEIADIMKKDIGIEKVSDVIKK